ncbi:unnamed protein product [Orchesella dallaii]|uniref:Uncharacterized protein n=1 Tax=Orchesella dallaii TaxID=48710 RepID=A0ABP1QYE2_9HEXA
MTSNSGGSCNGNGSASRTASPSKSCGSGGGGSGGSNGSTGKSNQQQQRIIPIVVDDGSSVLKLDDTPTIPVDPNAAATALAK